MVTGEVDVAGIAVVIVEAVGYLHFLPPYLVLFIVFVSSSVKLFFFA